MPEPIESEACAHWIGADRRHCRSTDRVRLYLIGRRCPDHTPNALKGLPEPGPENREATT
ncbi:hypothetical protein ABZZ79_02945 [Streptomyces sp. NPDC006458]|uniref:hypothetical protein n=1 Tax=Streptomyces sp. NPDC006458 TaxID=3154302 RepID=UPI0033BE94D4